MSGSPPEQQRRLLDLQALDSRSDHLDRAWRDHPAAAEVERMSAEADELAVRLTAAEQAVDEAAGRLRSAEREAEDITRRQQKDQTRLDAGSVSSPRELESLQHEIETLQAKLDEVETAELEAMEELDSVQTQVSAVREQVTRVEEIRTERQAELDAARAAIDTEREALAADRAALVAELPDDLVRLYERSRAQHAGVGVGALRHGRCEACRLSLTPADLARVAAAAPDELLRCEECGRLLVRVDD
jgi:predicted  nucleic acid-binding Zn-ribbon protein